MKIETQDREPLSPRKLVSISGKIRYSEGNQAWNIIKLKTEFLNEFKQLKEKRSNFSYEMIFGRDEKDMIEALKKVLKEGRMMPIIMYLYKENEN